MAVAAMPQRRRSLWPRRRRSSVAAAWPLRRSSTQLVAAARTAACGPSGWRRGHDTGSSEAADRPQVVRECCARLQKINGMLKKRIAEMDAVVAHDAMKGGVTGLGCDNRKLISVLCTRTKAALERTRVAYRKKYELRRPGVVDERGGVAATARVTGTTRTSPQRSRARRAPIMLG